ncbi:MAG: hypothetical protein EHM33_08275 [Chloroflexi bacterium]|nr:MAG: hypothetical protein EHM33_08275 [Chloroflexota bacterium]
MLTNNSSLLKNTLFGNSAFSFISGIAFLLFSKAIASFLGLAASWIIPALGVGLIVYGIEIYLAAKAEPVHTGIAKFAIYADLAWVLGSAVLIFANLVPFTNAGKWTIAIIADIVLVFAIFQYVGLRRLAK